MDAFARLQETTGLSQSELQVKSAGALAVQSAQFNFVVKLFTVVSAAT